MDSDSLESEKNLYSLIGKWEPASLREEIYGFVYWKPLKVLLWQTVLTQMKFLSGSALFAKINKTIVKDRKNIN